MALSQGVKDTIDAFSNTDKLLVIHYALGIDNAPLSLKVAKAFVNAYWSQHDPDELTNDQLSQAVMRKLFDYQKKIYQADQSKQAANTAREDSQDATDTEVGDNPTDDLPAVEEA